MTEAEAQAFIESNVRVTHELVVRAKAYAVQHFITETPRLVEGFLQEEGVAHPGDIPLDTPEAENACKRLYSFASRLKKVRDYYADRDLCQSVWSSSGVSKDAIIQVAIWADQVRDARNVVHYQAEAALPNTYEKVAALLMGAAPYLRQVYAALAAAKGLAP